MSKKNSKFVELLPAFWIHRKIRDLRIDEEGTGSWNSIEDFFYVCPPGLKRDLMEEGYSLTTWFYQTLEKLKEYESKGKHVVFEIRAFPGEKYFFCDECGGVDISNPCHPCRKKEKK